jgi:gamma-glutamylcyclotransferase (GGCT)/AIG2-like uncharacterized protein YtfP
MTLVAVYGSLRKGFHNHYLLEGSKYIGSCITSPDYKMYSLGSFPAVVAGDSPILIELYEVSSETLTALDRLEGVPTFYDKDVIETPYGTADIYIYQKPLEYLREEELVETGVWECSHF